MTIRAYVGYLTSVMTLEYGRSGLGKAVGEKLCGEEVAGTTLSKHETC